MDEREEIVGNGQNSDSDEKSSIVPTEELIPEVQNSSDEGPSTPKLKVAAQSEEESPDTGLARENGTRIVNLPRQTTVGATTGVNTITASSVKSNSTSSSGSTLGGSDKKRRPLSTVSLDDLEVVDVSGRLMSDGHDSDYEFVEEPANGGQVIMVRRTSDHAANSRQLSNPTAPLEPPQPTSQLNAGNGRAYGSRQPEASSVQNARDPLREARFQLLTQFSKVTNLAKSTTSSILSHPLSTPFLPLLPPSIASLSSEYSRARGRSGSLEAVLNEFGEAARAYVGQMLNNEVWTTEGTEGFEVVMCDHTRVSTAGIISERGQRYTLLTPEKWITMVQDQQSRLTIPLETLREMVFFGGVDMDIRDSVWKWLLGYWDGRGRKEDSVLNMTPPLSRYPSARNTMPNSPVTARSPISSASLTHAQPITSLDGPSNPDLETAEEYKKRRRDEYYHLMASWTAIISVRRGSPPSAASDPTAAEVVDRLHRVVKDVMRTDRNIPFFSTDSAIDEDGLLDIGSNTNAPNMEKLRDVLLSYTMYDWDLGYVQGMSDLCAPILVAMRGDESECFWCFVGIMKSMRGNFKSDQIQMHRKLTTLRQLIQYMDPELYVHFQRSESLNMFFAFRWLLIAFKREFGFHEIMSLWEALWSDWLTSNFDLFVALSILDLRRDDIIGKLTSFDEILKYVNDLSGHLSVSRVLRNAEVLFYQFHNKVKHVEQEIAAGSASPSSNGSGSESENRPPSEPRTLSPPAPMQTASKKREQIFKNKALEEELTTTLKAAFLA